MTPEMARGDRAAWDRWRAKIPFTDAEILAALDSEIAEGGRGEAKTREVREWFARTQILTWGLYRHLLPRLVRICGICRKPAHYRYGHEGRCREHKMLATTGFQRRVAIIEGRFVAKEMARNEFDKRMRKRDEKHALHVGRQQKA